MKVINIVATATVDKPFNLEALKMSLKGSEQAASRAKWLKMRLPKSKEYVAFYRSGKFLITGATSVESVLEIVQKVVKLLGKNKVKVKIKDIKIHNVVVSDKVAIRDSLEKIIVEHEELSASYEPEQFPAMIIQGDGCTFLLFSSGKIICAGNKSIEDAERNVKWLKKALRC